MLHAHAHVMCMCMYARLAKWYAMTDPHGEASRGVGCRSVCIARCRLSQRMHSITWRTRHSVPTCVLMPPCHPATLPGVRAVGCGRRPANPSRLPPRRRRPARRRSTALRLLPYFRSSCSFLHFTCCTVDMALGTRLPGDKKLARFPVFPRPACFFSRFFFNGARFIIDYRSASLCVRTLV